MRGQQHNCISELERKAVDAAQADDLDGALAALDEGVKLAPEYCSVYNNRFVDTLLCFCMHSSHDGALH